MTAPTHISFACLVYLLVLTTTGVALSFVNGAVIGIAAILPDIDTGASRMGHLVPELSRAIERRFGHRTLTHSALCIAGLALLLLPLLSWERDLYLCILVGYATHPFLDTMTISGVKLFYPFSSVRCVFPFDVNHPARYRTRTGSTLDKLLGVAFLLGCIPTFFVAREGYERFVRYAQKNIESAVRDYNEFSRANIVFAWVSGHDLLTKEHVEGKFEIVGALNSHTLLFRGQDGRLHSLGNEYQAEYVAESALCERGDPVRVVVRRVNMENLLLAEIGSYGDSAVESLFFGDLTTPDHFMIPQEGQVFAPVTGSSGIVRLHFASLNDIRDLQLDNLFVARGTLTARTLVREDHPESPSPAPVAGFPGNPYARVGCETNQDVPPQVLCAKGDTVSAAQVLVRWGAAVDADARIGLIDGRIAALRAERAARLLDLNGKIGKARDAVGADSMKWSGALDLARKGFVMEDVARMAGRRYRDARDALMHAVRSAQILRTKTDIGIRKLAVERASLGIRHMTARGRSELRSPARGIIADVRQEVRNGRLHLTILIRRL